MDKPYLPAPARKPGRPGATEVVAPPTLSQKATFYFEPSSSGGFIFSAFCGSAEAAIEVKKDIQTLCGSRLERDEDYLYVIVDAERKDEAIMELEGSGYATNDSEGDDPG